MRRVTEIDTPFFMRETCSSDNLCTICGAKRDRIMYTLQIISDTQIRLQICTILKSGGVRLVYRILQIRISCHSGSRCHDKYFQYANSNS
jgi:hypothetical protein